MGIRSPGGNSTDPLDRLCLPNIYRRTDPQQGLVLSEPLEMRGPRDSKVTASPISKPRCVHWAWAPAGLMHTETGNIQCQQGGGSASSGIFNVNNCSR